MEQPHMIQSDPNYAAAAAALSLNLTPDQLREAINTLQASQQLHFTNTPPQPTIPKPNSSQFRWVRLPMNGKDIPPPLTGHTLTAGPDNRLFLFGGRTSRNECLNELFVFETDALNWRKPATSGTPPSPRRDHSAVLWGDKIYIYGGYNDATGEYLDDLYILDTITMRWDYLNVPGDQPPGPLRGHASFVLWGNLFIHGGQTVGGRCVSGFHYVHLHTGSTGWAIMPQEGIPPSPRAYHSVTVVGNVFLFYGGTNGSMVFGDLYGLDLQDNTQIPVWRQIQLRTSTMYPLQPMGESSSSPSSSPLLHPGTPTSISSHRSLSTTGATATATLTGIGGFNTSMNQRFPILPRFGHSCLPLGPNLLFLGGSITLSSFPAQATSPLPEQTTNDLSLLSVVTWSNVPTPVTVSKTNPRINGEDHQFATAVACEHDHGISNNNHHSRNKNVTNHSHRNNDHDDDDDEDGPLYCYGGEGCGIVGGENAVLGDFWALNLGAQAVGTRMESMDLRLV
ncbi:hypothetical protein HDU76_013524 [Blyttiomyces sp. JEL0837]|nr:hypothetical protein HDU76_013524 [Blyttiomyces sp. JEL0837]